MRRETQLSLLHNVHDSFNLTYEMQQCFVLLNWLKGQTLNFEFYFPVKWPEAVFAMMFIINL